MKLIRKKVWILVAVCLFLLIAIQPVDAQTPASSSATSVPTPTSVEAFKSSSNGEYYCLTNVGNRPRSSRCPDEANLEIQKGAAGVTGLCGSVIEWDQRIMESLQQISGNGVWDTVSAKFSSCNYTREPYISGYSSTINIIDAYNLAGFREMSMSTHTDGAYMLAWWKSNAASTAGYKWVEYPGGSPQRALRSVLPGYVMFIGHHTGIVNSVEVDGRGNGFITILHANTPYWLGIFPVFNWNIMNIPTSVLGFGGH